MEGLTENATAIVGGGGATVGTLVVLYARALMGKLTNIETTLNKVVTKSEVQDERYENLKLRIEKLEKKIEN